MIKKKIKEKKLYHFSKNELETMSGAIICASFEVWNELYPKTSSINLDMFAELVLNRIKEKLN